MEVPPLSPQAKNFAHGTYRHYKGGEYHTHYIARHSETQEELVVYQDVTDTKKVWCRSLVMFLDTVLVEGKSVPRFTKIS